MDITYSRYWVVVVFWKGDITHVNSFDLNAISRLHSLDMGCLPSAIFLLVRQIFLFIHPRYAEGTLHQFLTL